MISDGMTGELDCSSHGIMTSLTCHHLQELKAESSQRLQGISLQWNRNRTLNCVQRHSVCLQWHMNHRTNPWQSRVWWSSRKASPSLCQINRQDVQIWFALDCPRFSPYNWFIGKSRANDTCWVHIRLVLGQIALDFPCDSISFQPAWANTAPRKCDSEIRGKSRAMP